jgi:hypothetical protein
MELAVAAAVGGIYYNLSLRSSLCMTPFKVVYGRDPSVLRPYSLGEARFPTMHIQMMERDESLLVVHGWLE